MQAQEILHFIFLLADFKNIAFVYEFVRACEYIKQSEHIQE